MIALAALLIGAAPIADAVAADEEIVVSARRMATIEAVLDFDRSGRGRCSINVSSGYVAIDAMICTEAVRCLKDRTATEAAIRTCVDARKPKLIARIAKKLKQMRNDHA